MCGRISFVTTKKKIKAIFGDQVQIPNVLLSSYNIAPTQQALVLTNTAADQLQLFNWGLIPFWSKDTKMAARLINARSEEIENKPSFRMPIRKQRCLVLADSFYEWRQEGKLKKPFRIQRTDEQLLTFAGIWDQWQEANKTIHSFSIITTTPNQEMAAIHNRMPVILESAEEQGKWLADLSLAQTLEMLVTPRDGLLKHYSVSTSVNSVRNNGAHLHKEVNDEPLTLF